MDSGASGMRGSEVGGMHKEIPGTAAGDVCGVSTEQRCLGTPVLHSCPCSWPASRLPVRVARCERVEAIVAQDDVIKDRNAEDLGSLLQARRDLAVFARG